ncbi:MAG: hypothetical protein ACJ8AO_00875 [Gemmatimonadaceae bacterium]
MLGDSGETGLPRWDDARPVDAGAGGGGEAGKEPSENFLHSPTGEYPVEPASDLVSFPNAAEMEWVPELQVTGESPTADQRARPWGDPPSERPAEALSDRSPDLEPPGAPALPWGGSPAADTGSAPMAPDAITSRQDPFDPPEDDSHEIVDETGLWALPEGTPSRVAEPERRDSWAATIGGADAPGAVREPAGSQALSGEPSPTPQDEYALVLDKPGIDPTGEPTILAGDEEMVPTGDAPPVAGESPDPGEPRPGGHRGPDPAYPDAASSVYAREWDADWSVAQAGQPVEDVAARAELADRIAAVAQRVRSGQLPIPGLMSLDSDEAALAAALAALLSRGRSRS